MFSDSQAAVAAATHRAGDSSQKEALEVQSVLTSGPWKDRIHVQWCPGHTGVEENEKADRAAVEASRRETGDRRWTPTVARVRAAAREEKARRVAQWWRAVAPENYKWVGRGP